MQLREIYPKGSVPPPEHFDVYVFDGAPGDDQAFLDWYLDRLQGISPGYSPPDPGATMEFTDSVGSSGFPGRVLTVYSDQANSVVAFQLNVGDGVDPWGQVRTRRQLAEDYISFVDGLRRWREM